MPEPRHVFLNCLPRYPENKETRKTKLKRQCNIINTRIAAVHHQFDVLWYFMYGKYTEETSICNNAVVQHVHCMCIFLPELYEGTFNIVEDIYVDTQYYKNSINVEDHL